LIEKETNPDKNMKINFEQHFKPALDNKIRMTAMIFVVITYRIEDSEDSKSKDMLKELLKNGAKINNGIKEDVNRRAKTAPRLIANALLVAARIKSISLAVARVLAEYSFSLPQEAPAENKLEVNIADDKGNTPMHYGALLDNVEFVKYLIDELFADANITNDNNEKPIDLSPANSKTRKYLSEIKGDGSKLTKSKLIKRNDGKFGIKVLSFGNKPEVIEIQHFERLRTELQEIAGHYEQFPEFEFPDGKLKQFSLSLGEYAYGVCDSKKAK